MTIADDNRIVANLIEWLYTDAERGMGQNNRFPLSILQ
jgi:hypothetical protein